MGKEPDRHPSSFPVGMSNFLEEGPERGLSQVESDPGTAGWEVGDPDPDPSQPSEFPGEGRSLGFIVDNFLVMDFIGEGTGKVAGEEEVGIVSRKEGVQKETHLTRDRKISRPSTPWNEGERREGGTTGTPGTEGNMQGTPEGGCPVRRRLESGVTGVLHRGSPEAALRWIRPVLSGPLVGAPTAKIGSGSTAGLKGVQGELGHCTPNLGGRIVHLPGIYPERSSVRNSVLYRGVDAGVEVAVALGFVRWFPSR
jgi:hypothetical protein